MATNVMRHSSVGHCSPVTVFSPEHALTSISIDVRNAAVMQRAQAHDLPDAHRALEEQVVHERRHAGPSRVPLGADDAAEVDPRHDLPAEDRAVEVRVLRQHVLEHLGRRGDARLGDERVHGVPPGFDRDEGGVAAGPSPRPDHAA